MDHLGKRFMKAAVQLFAIAKNRNSAFTSIRNHNKKLPTKRLPTVDIGSADNCQIFVTTMRVLSSSGETPINSS